MARPYGNESGLGWGGGDGMVTGEQLSGEAQWSNQPRLRGDGVMLLNVRRHHRSRGSGGLLRSDGTH